MLVGVEPLVRPAVQNSLSLSLRRFAHAAAKSIARKQIATNASSARGGEIDCRETDRNERVRAHAVAKSIAREFFSGSLSFVKLLQYQQFERAQLPHVMVGEIVCNGSV